MKNLTRMERQILKYADNHDEVITRELVSPSVNTPLDRGDRTIYFVQAIEGDDLIKIGMSSNFPKRFTELRNASPVPLRMIATVRGGGILEGALHAKFRHHRSHGEWFYPVPELLKFIEWLVAEANAKASANEHKPTVSHNLAPTQPMKKVFYP